jgi:CubicO group peptidase (beta-lactamase class C family)
MREPEFHSSWVTASGTERGSGNLTGRFPFWSFTKTIIAVCTLKLCEDGVLDLDGRLDGVSYTLRQLLAHTSGLADYGSIPDYHRAVAAEEEPWPRDILLKAVLAKGPLFAPGEGWSYSNVGYMLAREQIEMVSGLGFAHLVDDIICRPLGLASIELATTHDQFSRLYWKAAERYHPGWVYHGCLTGTVVDAARVLHGLFSGRLLCAAMLKEMLARRPLGGKIPGRPWTDCGYGLGLMNGRMGGSGRAIGHSGGGPFSVNAIYHFPDRDDPVTVACFTDGKDEGQAEFFAAGLAHVA